jgi:hypothetical protein
MATRVQVDNRTQIKKVKVGTPVRRVIQARNDLSALGDVDVTNLNAGALLQYSETNEKWVATNNVETDEGELRLNGGVF